jgi:hypothetical protein
MAIIPIVIGKGNIKNIAIGTGDE